MNSPRRMRTDVQSRLLSVSSANRGVDRADGMQPATQPPPREAGAGAEVAPRSGVAEPTPPSESPQVVTTSKPAPSKASGPLGIRLPAEVVSGRRRKLTIPATAAQSDGRSQRGIGAGGRTVAMRAPRAATARPLVLVPYLIFLENTHVTESLFVADRRE